MSTIGADCPHCHKKNVSFRSVCSHKANHSYDTYTVFFICGNCEKGLVADIKARESQTPHDYEAGLEGKNTFQVLSTYPKPTKIESPQYLPDNINNFYIQALKNLQNGNWDAAGIMSRKVIDVATKKLDMKVSGSLYSRIEKLASNSLITPAMKEWAHSIRLDGNEAAHDEEPMSPDTAKSLLSFTEIFLMYAFTLPGMLLSRQTKKEQE